LNFISFDIESGNSGCNFDYLDIYDGAIVGNNLIDRYCNDNIPTTVSSSGGAITLRFHSDDFTGGTGFEVDWVCNYPTGINDLNDVSNIISFINASNNLELNLNNLVNGGYNLVLYNTVGQKIISEQINITSDIQKEIVSLSGVADGIYYLNLSNENDNYTSKLVK